MKEGGPASFFRSTIVMLKKQEAKRGGVMFFLFKIE